MVNPKDANVRRHVAVVPPCTWPRTLTVNVLLILFFLQAIVCLFDSTLYPYPFSVFLTPLQRGLLYIFRTPESLRWFFYCTLLIHFLEALYALLLIRRFLRGSAAERGGYGGISAIQWALQTALVGFPSLVLLMRLLSDKSSSSSSSSQ